MPKQIYFLVYFSIISSASFIDCDDIDYVESNLSRKIPGATIMFTNNNGLQFTKENNPDGTMNIMYDCEIGLTNEGVVDINDYTHLKHFRSLIIRNCYNITLNVRNSNFFNFSQLIVIKTTSLYIRRIPGKDFYYRSNYITHVLPSLNINFTDVEHVFLQDLYPIKGSLVIKNAKLYQLTLNNKYLEHLQLENIEVESFKSMSLAENYWYNYSRKSVIIKDSHFNIIKEAYFNIEAFQVQMINNTFEYLGEGAFQIIANRSFVFSGNHVKVMENPFYLSSSNVQIVENIFEKNLRPWIYSIILLDEYNPRILNISSNKINGVSLGIFNMSALEMLDFILFENNSLYCTCSNLRQFSMSTETLNFIKLNQNTCVNFDNCQLNLALLNVFRVCSNKFNVSEAMAKSEKSTTFYLENILLELRNMSKTLNFLATRQNSVLTVGEESKTSLSPIYPEN